MSKSVKSIVSTVVGFIGHYGDEALATADALASILDGVALSNADTAKVHATIAQLRAAAENISKAPEVAAITIAKSDIDKAVADFIRSGGMAELVQAEVAKALAAMPTSALVGGNA